MSIRIVSICLMLTIACKTASKMEAPIEMRSLSESSNKYQTQDPNQNQVNDFNLVAIDTSQGEITAIYALKDDRSYGWNEYEACRRDQCHYGVVAASPTYIALPQGDYKIRLRTCISAYNAESKKDSCSDWTDPKSYTSKKTASDLNQLLLASAQANSNETLRQGITLLAALDKLSTSVSQCSSYDRARLAQTMELRTVPEHALGQLIPKLVGFGDSTEEIGLGLAGSVGESTVLYGQQNEGLEVAKVINGPIGEFSTHPVLTSIEEIDTAKLPSKIDTNFSQALDSIRGETQDLKAAYIKHQSVMLDAVKTHGLIIDTIIARPKTYAEKAEIFSRKFMVDHLITGENSIGYKQAVELMDYAKLNGRSFDAADYFLLKSKASNLANQIAMEKAKKITQTKQAILDGSQHFIAYLEGIETDSTIKDTYITNAKIASASALNSLDKLTSTNNLERVFEDFRITTFAQISGIKSDLRSQAEIKDGLNTRYKLVSAAFQDAEMSDAAKANFLKSLHNLTESAQLDLNQKATVEGMRERLIIYNNSLTDLISKADKIAAKEQVAAMLNSRLQTNKAPTATKSTSPSKDAPTPDETKPLVDEKVKANFNSITQELQAKFAKNGEITKPLSPAGNLEALRVALDHEAVFESDLNKKVALGAITQEQAARISSDYKKQVGIRLSASSQFARYDIDSKTFKASLETLHGNLLKTHAPEKSSWLGMLGMFAVAASKSVFGLTSSCEDSAYRSFQAQLGAAVDNTRVLSDRKNETLGSIYLNFIQQK